MLNPFYREIKRKTIYILELTLGHIRASRTIGNVVQLRVSVGGYFSNRHLGVGVLLVGKVSIVVAVASVVQLAALPREYLVNTFVVDLRVHRLVLIVAVEHIVVVPRVAQGSQAMGVVHRRVDILDDPASRIPIHYLGLHLHLPS